MTHVATCEAELERVRLAMEDQVNALSKDFCSFPFTLSESTTFWGPLHPSINFFCSFFIVPCALSLFVFHALIAYFERI